MPRPATCACLTIGTSVCPQRSAHEPGVVATHFPVVRNACMCLGVHKAHASSWSRVKHHACTDLVSLSVSLAPNGSQRHCHAKVYLPLMAPDNDRCAHHQGESWKPRGHDSPGSVVYKRTFRLLLPPPNFDGLLFD